MAKFNTRKWAGGRRSGVRGVLSLMAGILLVGCTATRVYQPKQLYVTGSFRHRATGIEFPARFNRFARESITSFNRDSTDIGVSYRLGNPGTNALATVYVYPASAAMEDRIRDEYFKCLGAIANATTKGIDVTSKPLRISKGGYSVIGLYGTIRDNRRVTALVLFECGNYFLKYRISSDDTDTGAVSGIVSELTAEFSPLEIVKKQPLSIWATIHIAPGLLNDTASLYAVATAVREKNNWVLGHVDSLERCAGYPGLYFEEQRVSVTGMLKRWERSTNTGSPYAGYFDDLIKIRDSGFLNEYIYDQYGGTLLLTDEVTLDFEKYLEWKKKNNPTVSLTGPIYYYFIGFEGADKKNK